MKQNLSLLQHFPISKDKIFLVLGIFLGMFALIPITNGQPIAWDEVVQLAWSPDGGQIAIAGGASGCDPDMPSDHVLRILDITTQITRRLEGHSCRLVDVAWNSDGTQIVSSGFTNAETFIWDVATGTIIKKVRLGTEIGVGVFWRPNSTEIASIGSGGKYAFVWDSVTGEILYALPQHADFTTSATYGCAQSSAK